MMRFMLETGRQVDRSTGSQMRTMKVIDMRHKNLKGYKEFTEIILFMWETGRQVDR